MPLNNPPASPVGLVNRIINPSGRVQQDAIGSQADVSYDFDQWIVLTQSNPVTSSQVTNAENGTPYMMRLSQANASAQRFGRIQFLEQLDCIDLRGKSVVLSARVRMSASTTLRYAILEWTGTANAPTKDAVNDWTSATFTGGNFFVGTNYTITATGSIALTANALTDITALVATLGSSLNNLAVIFWTDSTQAQNVTLDIGKVQLEVSASATAFAQIPFAAELRLCQRFFCKSYNQNVVPGTADANGCAVMYPGASMTGTMGIAVRFPVTMHKVLPTVTMYDLAGASGKVWRGANGKTASQETVSDGGFTGLTTDTTASTVLYFQWKADARM